MATMNSVNTTLSGQTGTGAFVGGTSPTFTTSIITPLLKLTGGDIVDANDKIVLQLGSIGSSAINYLNLDNSDTGTPLAIEAIGLDASISINYKTQGSGTHRMLTGSNTGLVIESGTSYQHVTNFEFTNTANTRTVTFPDSDGTVQFVSGAVGFQWVTYAGTSTTMSQGRGYVLTNAAAVTAQLPVTASSVGDTIKIKGKSSAPWVIQCNVGEVITMGSASTTAGGTLTASAGTDTIQLVYVASNEWSVDFALSDGAMVLA